MEKDLTFEELTRLVGTVVISCSYNGTVREEYVIEEYDNEHGRISVSSRNDNRVTSIWLEEIYMWHFRLPRSYSVSCEGKCCPMKFGICSCRCAWFNEETGLCAVFRK